MKLDFSLIEAVLTVVILVVVRYVVPAIKTTVGEKNLQEVVSWVTVFVQAAEMKFLGNKTGAEKKAYVVDLLTKELNKRKIEITDEQMDALIESAVKQLKIAEEK